MPESNEGYLHYLTYTLGSALKGDSNTPLEYDQVRIRRVKNVLGMTIRRTQVIEHHGVIEPHVLREMRLRAIECMVKDLSQVGELKTAEKIIFDGQ